MQHLGLAIVTGVCSYTGSYVARRLLGQGVRVRTLIRNPNAEGPLAGHAEAAPPDFSDPDRLSRSMQGRVSSTTHTGYSTNRGAPLCSSCREHHEAD